MLDILLSVEIAFNHPSLSGAVGMVFYELLIPLPWAPEPPLFLKDRRCGEGFQLFTSRGDPTMPPC